MAGKRHVGFAVSDPFLQMQVTLFLSNVTVTFAFRVGILHKSLEQDTAVPGTLLHLPVAVLVARFVRYVPQSEAS